MVEHKLVRGVVTLMRAPDSMVVGCCPDRADGRENGDVVTMMEMLHMAFFLERADPVSLGRIQASVTRQSLEIVTWPRRLACVYYGVFLGSPRGRRAAASTAAS